MELSGYVQYVEIVSIAVAILVTFAALVFSYKYTLRSMQIGVKRPTESKTEVNDMSKANPPEEESDKTEEEDDAVEETEPPLDPLEFCEHIHGEVKRVQNRVTTRKIEEKMTAEQKIEEREAQRKQLEAIFNLMKDNNEKFGVDSFDDVKKQMHLYA